MDPGKEKINRLFRALSEAARGQTAPTPSENFTDRIMADARRTALAPSRRKVWPLEEAAISRVIWWSASGAALAALVLALAASSDSGMAMDLIAIDSVEMLPFAL